MAIASELVPQGKQSPRFIPELESLRGLAALAVVIFHGCSYFWLYPARPDQVVIQSIFKHTLTGFSYVALFFTLSGLVLLLQLSSYDLTSPKAWLKFWVRRLLRLLPPAWASVFFAVGICLHIGFPADLGLPLVGSTLLFQDYTLNAVLWSLKVEILCSLALPFGLIILLKLSRRMAWNALLLFIFASLMLGGPFNMFFPSFFAAGVLCYGLRDRFAELSPRTQVWAWLLAGACFAFSQDAPGLLRFGLLLIAVMIPVSLAFAHSGQPSTRFLRWPPVRFLGRISFSLYLVHFPIHVWTNMVVTQWIPLKGAGDNLALLALANFSLLIGPSLLAAWLGYTFIELPTIRLSRRLSMASSRRLGSRLSAALQFG